MEDVVKGPPTLADLFSPDALANPYPYYRRLREYAPVYDTGEGVWLITSFDCCQSLLNDRRSSKDLRRNMEGYEQAMESTGRTPEIRALLEQLMAFNDPPQHTRIRERFQRAFSPRLVRHLSDRAHFVANELLDEVAGDPEIDLIADFGWRFPLTMVAELLGVPVSDRERFHEWSRDLVPAFELYITPEQGERGWRAAQEFIAYFEELIEDRSKHPRDDFVSGLLIGDDEGSGESIVQQLVVNLILILAAGHDTTMNLIGNGMIALIQNPDQLKVMRERPDITENAIEEMLRFDAPIQMTTRIASEDIEIEGRTIPRGARTTILLGAGNRDPSHFPEPDRFDITRPDVHHLALGYGVHYCLGNALARIEGGVAFRALLDRYPQIEIAVDPLDYREGILQRGVNALPLAVGMG